MPKALAVKFNEENRKKKTGQFPIECIIQEIGKHTGKHLNKRRAFYGGQAVARRDLSSMKLAEGQFICLKRQDLSALDLTGIDFRKADLTDAQCRFADFTGAKMDGANIEGADLTGAIISPQQLRSTTGKPYAYPHGRGVTAPKIMALRQTRNRP